MSILNQKLIQHVEKKKSEQGRHQLVLVIDMSQCSEPMVFTDNSKSPQKREIRESFLPRNKPAIR